MHGTGVFNSQRYGRSKNAAGTVLYDDYYNANWQLVERQVPTNKSYTRYVWGLRYIDDLVCRYRDTDADGEW